MAEFIFKQLVSAHHMDAQFQIASSATSTEEIWNGHGNPIYPPAKRELERHGICGFEEKRAVQLTREDYPRYDLFVGMDDKNIRNMHRILGGDPDGKIHKLMEYAGEGGDVSDPWYSDRFDIAYRDIEKGCRALFEYLSQQNNK